MYVAYTYDVMCHVPAFLHDAVLLWAYGVNKSISKGQPPDDGFQITQNVLNMTFQGISGPVTIDSNGDRQPDQR